MKRFYKTFRKYKKDTQVKDDSKRKGGTEIVCYEYREPGHSVLNKEKEEGQSNDGWYLE